LISSSHTAPSLPYLLPRNAFSPAIADLRLRAPLPPHLAQHINIIYYIFLFCKAYLHHVFNKKNVEKCKILKNNAVYVSFRAVKKKILFDKICIKDAEVLYL